MASVVIPDKICRNCNGTNWYVYGDSTFCVHCHRIRMKMWTKSARARGINPARDYMRRQRDKLGDAYIRRIIYTVILNSTGEKIKSTQISQEQIERYRKGLQIRRINRKLIKNEGKMETITDDVKKVKKQRSEKELAKRREYSRKYWQMKKAERQALIDASVLGDTPKPKTVTASVRTPAVKSEIELLFETITEQRKQLKLSIEKLTQLLSNL